MTTLFPFAIATQKEEPQEQERLLLQTATTPLSYITGGTPAAAGQYPFFGLTDYRASDGFVCGATVIWPDIMVTAAHCQGAFLNVKMFIGTTLNTGADALTTAVTLKEIPHPKYKKAADNSYDVMVLQLDRTVGLADNQIPAWNTDPSVPAESGAAVTVIGFGRLSTDNRTTPFTLQQSVDFKTSTACENFFNEYKSDIMMCAGGTGSASQACFGDSGGPLMVQEGEGAVPVLVGVVSFSTIKCEGNPQGYTRLSAMNDFLKAAICSFSSVPPADCPKRRTRVCPSIYNCVGNTGRLKGNKSYSGSTIHLRFGAGGGSCKSRCENVSQKLWIRRIGWECGPC